MIWQPLNLTQACPIHTDLTACSYFGFVYLNFLAQLLGGSREKNQRQNREEYFERERVLKGVLTYERNYDSDRIVKGINNYADVAGVSRRTYLNEESEHQYERERDGVVKKKESKEEYDFIVVGAGSAGCVVANRLTEVKGWKVLLLEAGPEQPDVTLVPGLSTALQGSNIDWGYTTEPNGVSCLARNGRCGWPRGKMMGGSSSINTLVYVRGNRLDYDDWARAGNRGWSYEEILPYYRKLEKNMNIEAMDRRHHGTHGLQSISRYPFIDRPSIMLTESFTQLGLPYLDINGAQQLGNVQTQAFSEDGVRVSANNAYIEPIRHKRKNLKVKTEAEVVHILTDKHKRAYGVQYIKDGKVYKALAKREVIVSGGTINSPKLLMLSGIGPKEHLDELHIPVIKDLRVGENLHDHVTFTGLIIALSNKTATMVDNVEMLKLINEYTEMENKEGPLSSTGPYNSVAFLKTDPHLPAPDVQIQTASRIWREYIKEPVQYETLEILPSVFYDSIVPRVQNLIPYSRGKMLLNASNPYGPPLLYPNYLSDKRDYLPIKRGVRIIINMEKTEAFQKSGSHFVKIPLPACKHTVWGTDEYVECMTKQYTFALSHQVGSCKMGPEWDKTAVVDPRLRVRGIAGLRVIDNSIIPKVIRGNTNAPAMMIGEKGADMIKEDWGVDIHHYDE